MMAAPQPDELRISLTTPSGVSYSLEWKGQALEYRAYNEHYDPTRMERLEPSLESWAKFWQGVETADAWAWQARYLNPGEDEGIQWQIALRLEDREVRSYGDNAFPGAESTTQVGPSASPLFEAFHHALKHLIGDLPLE